LKKARQEKGWTQQQVADLIGAPHSFMVNRWENGTVFPSLDYCTKLTALFHKSQEELGLQRSLYATHRNSQTGPWYDDAIPYHLVRTLIGRQQEVAEIKQHLLHSEQETRVALHGLPGVGKTALALEVVHDTEVRNHFEDGILWANLGPHADLVSLFAHWGKQLGMCQEAQAALQTKEDWLQALHHTLSTRHMLIVIDDAWTIEEALSCLVGGMTCRYLLTTRSPAVAHHFASVQTMGVSELSLENGIQLLSQQVPELALREPEAIKTLACLTDGLPLALTLVGNQLQVQAQQKRRLQKTLERLSHAEERLQLRQPQAGLVQDFRFPDTPLSMQAVIRLSEEQLPVEARLLLYALAVFEPKPNTFSEEAVLAITAGTPAMLDCLVDAGLIESIWPDRYQIHRTITDYARTHHLYDKAARHMLSYYLKNAGRYKEDPALLEQELTNIYSALTYAARYGEKATFIQGILVFTEPLQRQGLQISEEQRQQLEGLASTLNHLHTLALLL